MGIKSKKLSWSFSTRHFYLDLYQLLAVRSGTQNGQFARSGLHAGCCFCCASTSLKQEILILMQLQRMSTCEDVTDGSDVACYLTM